MSFKSTDSFNTKRIGINIIFSVLSFALNLFINFFVTPYITSNLGSEAYGFVKLANDFANYASVLSIALNSMASRFIMIERERGNKEKAEQYYSSVMFANIFLTVILVVPSLIGVFFLERIINIPIGLVVEVKITFLITFASFLVGLAFSAFGNCYYLTNRLDINSIRTMQSNIIRVVVIIGLFFLFSPKISYMTIGALSSTLFLSLCNIHYHKRLTPDLTAKRNQFRLKMIWEVISSGIWNSITRLSQILTSGLDLLITNFFIGSVEMGYLSIAKTVPGILVSFNSTIANTFSPNMMKLYAQGNIEELKRISKSAMKLMCIFVSIPTAVLISMGMEFFSLWVPEQPAQLINTLSILTVINSCITGPMQPLYQVFTITNKVRQNSVVMILYGLISIIVTYLFLQFTDLGLYAVAGVSFVLSILVAFFYHLPFSALYLGLPWYTFFPEILKSILSLLIQSLVGFVINFFLPLESSWIMWLIGVFVATIIGLVFNAFLILNHSERKQLLNIIINIKRKLFKRM